MVLLYPSLLQLYKESTLLDINHFKCEKKKGVFSQIQSSRVMNLIMHAALAIP